jgi:hypothetical protein
MDGFGWVVVAILVLLFGKNLGMTTAGLFNNPNAVPTPDGLPSQTIQNQGNPPTAQPAPWACGSSPLPKVQACPVWGCDGTPGVFKGTLQTPILSVANMGPPTVANNGLLNTTARGRVTFMQ